MKKILKDRRGVAAIEYGLIACLVSIAMLASMQSIGYGVKLLFGRSAIMLADGYSSSTSSSGTSTGGTSGSGTNTGGTTDTSGTSGGTTTSSTPPSGCTHGNSKKC